MNAYNHEAMRSITFVTTAEWKSRKASDEERQIYDAVCPCVWRDQASSTSLCTGTGGTTYAPVTMHNDFQKYAVKKKQKKPKEVKKNSRSKMPQTINVW